MFRRHIAVLGLILVSCSCAAKRASSPSPRQEMIQAIKRVQQELGFAETENFQHSGGAGQAYYHCYYTGKLELPESYEGLRLKDGAPSGCAVDEEKYDLFFYRIEAIAGTETPVTTALEESTPERMAVVVAHEDFHEDPQIQRLPTRIGEAATTLIGFLTAARYALQDHGADSELYRNLAREADLYQEKSQVVNRFHGEIGRLYREFESRSISREESLWRKGELYEKLREACEAIQPNPSSFNRCPAANNNAGLGFDITYTRYYPLLYDLHQALGGDLRRTIAALREAGRLGPGSEENTVRFFREMIQTGDGSSVSATGS